MFMIQCSPTAHFPRAAWDRKAQGWDRDMPIKRWEKWYLKRLSFLVIVTQPSKKSQGEDLQGCWLGAAPVKLDDVHSSLTALGENGSISTSLWVTFLLCRISICKCLKSSHLPGVLWLCYNCQHWEKAAFRLASPPCREQSKNHVISFVEQKYFEGKQMLLFFPLKKLLNCLEKSDSDLQKNTPFFLDCPTTGRRGWIPAMGFRSAWSRSPWRAGRLVLSLRTPWSSSSQPRFLHFKFRVYVPIFI